MSNKKPLLHVNWVKNPILLNWTRISRTMIDGVRQIRPNYSIESIKRVVTKALRLVAQNEIQKGFFTEKWFVKSTSSEMLDVVIVPQNGSIKRDKS